MKKATFFVCLILFFSSALQAQWHGGVKTGLNISNIKGPAETDANGATLEQMNNFTGFHIGPSFSYSVNDRFGLRGELLYSKKGMKYRYQGPSFRTFQVDNNGGTLDICGQSDVTIVHNQVCMDVPLSAYVKLGKVELSAGPYFSILFLRIADGAHSFSWKNNDGTDGKVDYTLYYNYNRDDPGEFVGVETQNIRVNNKSVTTPGTLGAYYDYTEDRGNLFKAIDYGVSGSMAVYLSRSLYVSGRVQYGLADLTRAEADLTRSQRNTDKTPITRNDKDYNFTIQASVGFSF